MLRPTSRDCPARYPPTAKLRLAALRHLSDWLVIGQIMPTNPAAAVRGPLDIVRRGKTPVLDPVRRASSSTRSTRRQSSASGAGRALIGLMFLS